MTWNLLSLFAAGTVVLASVSSDAAVLPYRFDKVAQTGGTYTSLGVPALNDGGVAAFSGTTSPGVTNVYYGNQFLVQQVPAVEGVFVRDRVDINNAGQVAFFGGTPTPPGRPFGEDVVLRAGPDGIREIGRSSAAIESYVNDGPAINNAGVVAYSTYSTVVSAVRAGDGSAEARGVGNTAAIAGGPRINNAGKVLWASRSNFGGAILYENTEVVEVSTFLPSSGTQFTDPDTGVSGPFSQFGHADLGDGDRVVFAARWNNLTDAFYLWNNGTLSKVAGTSGLTGIPAINDLGVVAGLIEGNGPERLALLEGGIEGTIVSVGQAFDGSVITDLSFSPEGFNNLNQLAFQATLADGRTVNVISQLPEPGAAGMILFAGAAMLARRRRGH